MDEVESVRKRNMYHALVNRAFEMPLDDYSRDAKYETPHHLYSPWFVTTTNPPIGLPASLGNKIRRTSFTITYQRSLRAGGYRSLRPRAGYP